MSAESLPTSDVIGLTKVAPFSRRGFMTASAAVTAGYTIAAGPVRVCHDCFHFLERVLRSVRIIAFRQNAASGANLDHVRAVLDHFANFGARSPRTVSDTFGDVVKFGRKQVVVAVAAGDA